MEAIRRDSAAPGAVRSGGLGIARVVRFVGSAAAAVIVAGILLVVFDANPANDIVNAVTDAARWLTGPFHDLFTLENRDWRVVVNWGLAAIAYLVVSRFIARFFAR